MASTAENTLAALALATGFNVAAAGPPLTSTLSPEAAKPPCTVSLNVFEGEKDQPVDERYINTPYAKKGDPKYSSDLFWGISWAGITYNQPQDIGDKKKITSEISFQPEANYHGWLKADGSGTYYEAKNHLTDLGKALVYKVDGSRYDARYTNWTQSAEYTITSPQDCLRVRKELLEAPLKPFSTNKILELDGTENANQFAARIWAKAGLPTWEDTTKTPNLRDEYEGIPGIKLISREQRLTEDRASGQLVFDPNIKPPKGP